MLPTRRVSGKQENQSKRSAFYELKRAFFQNKHAFTPMTFDITFALAIVSVAQENQPRRVAGVQFERTPCKQSHPFGSGPAVSLFGSEAIVQIANLIT